MLRDDQPLTPELTQAVCQRFTEYLTRVGKTQDWAARSMAISPTTISAIINNSFAADPEKHVRAMDKWLETQYLKEHAPRPSGFVKTGVAEQIYAAAKWAIESACIVLVHGPAGVGKTLAAQAIRAEMPGGIFITIRTAGQTKVSVLEAISQQLRLGTKATAAQLFESIVSVYEQSFNDAMRFLEVETPAFPEVDRG